jgi:3-oxoadipate enol-lactonase
VADSALTEHVLDRHGSPIHYWVGGPADHMAIVFTHGALVDHAQFMGQVDVLISDYRVVLWDMRGHGLSRPIGMAFGVPEAVNDLLAILDQEKIGKAIHAGQSTGTYVSQEFVFRYPEQVEALIIIDGTCITIPISGLQQMLLKTAPLMLRLYPFETLKRQSAEGSSIRKDVQQYMMDTITRIGRDDVINIMGGVVKCVHGEPGYTIEQPILLVHGDQDKLGNIAQIAPVWAKRDPRVTFEIIPNAGHNSNQDNVEGFNQIMLKFLESIGKTP